MDAHTLKVIAGFIALFILILYIVVMSIFVINTD